MTLHSCTIKLNDNSTLVCTTVEQSLFVIETHGQAQIAQICIDTTKGGRKFSYHLPYEESIESLMNL